MHDFSSIIRDSRIVARADPTKRVFGIGLGLSLALHAVSMLALYPVHPAPEIRPEEPAYEMAFMAPIPDPAPSAAATTPPEPLPEPSETLSAPPPPTQPQQDSSAPAVERPPNEPPDPMGAVAIPVPPPAIKPIETPPPQRPPLRPPTPRSAAPPRQIRQPTRPQPKAASTAETSSATAAEPAQAPPAIPSPPAAPPPKAPPIRPSPAWLAGVGAWLSAHRSYPDAARQRGQQGTVVVHFTVERDGHVRDVTVVRSSGSDTLDQAALALLQEARLPPFPADMTLSQQSMTVPIHYRLE